MSQQINLFNPLFIKKKMYFSLLAMLQGLGLILTGSLLFYAYAVYQVSVMDKLSEYSTKRLSLEQSRFAGYSAGYSPQQTNRLLQEELKQLDKKATEANLLVDTLRAGSVGNTTGYSEYMRAFARQVVPGLWLSGFKMTGDASQISLKGGVIAPELVPAYIQKLSKESVMQGKSFSNLQMQPAKDAKYLEFTLYSTPDDEVQP